MDERPGMTPQGRRAAAWTMVVTLAVICLILLIAF